MREIKLRVFDKTTEEMYFPGEDGTQLVIGMSHALDEDKNYMALWCNEGEIGREGDMEFSQFTGLYDKDGVEIYEGDITRASDDEVRVICYDILQAKYKAVPHYAYRHNAGEGGWTGYDLRNDKRHEIIGNIYENPELLEALE